MKLAFAFLAVPLLAQESVNLYSVEKEQAIGRQYASEIRRQSEPVGDPLVVAYVERIGRQLVSHLKEPRLEYTFEVISGGEWTEPFSLPGGYVFVPARALVNARDEDEFAGMLAHTVGHVALRHGTRSASRGQIANMASIPLVHMGGWSASHADSQNARVLVPLSFLEFQRTYELEADRFGLDLAARGGFNPSAFQRYVERTHPAYSKTSPLPARDLRLARIQEVVSTLAVSPRSVSAADFESVRERVRSRIERPQRHRVPSLRRKALAADGP